MEYKLISEKNDNLSVIQQVLINRGIALKDIDHYLNTTENDNLDPSLIERIKDGVMILIKHINNNDKILLQVDSDCDGYTSSSLLLNYLYQLFPYYVQNNILYRFHSGKEHGIIVSTIPEDVKLVIAPDSSSNDYEQHKELSEKGIDILVIDHHEAEKVSEYACVINNQLCDYPTKSLSGVGMVYKFCQLIDKILGKNIIDNYLDLVSLGMIADMMDLRDFETKYLINCGISNIRNPFLKGMIEKNAYSIGDDITPMGIAFYIAPYVNATIRMGSLEEKQTMFKSMLEYEAYNKVPSTKRGCKGQEEFIVEQAVRSCSNIKSRQTKARDTGVEYIENLIKNNNLLENKILLIQIPKEANIEKTLTGLIANQLMSKYQRPVLLLNETEQDNKICWEGSARGYEKSSLKDFRQFCLDSKCILYAEGHSNAFGFGVEDSKVKDFILYCNTTLKDFSFSPCYLVDFIFDVNNFNQKDILDIAELKSLWGQGIEEPYIALTNIKVTKNNIYLMSPDKNPTLKIVLSDGTSLIKFKSNEEEFNNLKSDGMITLNIVGRCERNAWNGRISPQIIIEDYEIAKKIEYYF